MIETFRRLIFGVPAGLVCTGVDKRIERFEATESQPLAVPKPSTVMAEPLPTKRTTTVADNPPFFAASSVRPDALVGLIATGEVVPWRVAPDGEQWYRRVEATSYIDRAMSEPTPMIHAQADEKSVDFDIENDTKEFWEEFDRQWEQKRIECERRIYGPLENDDSDHRDSYGSYP